MCWHANGGFNQEQLRIMLFKLFFFKFILKKSGPAAGCGMSGRIGSGGR